jgi:hypothetical protein
LKYHKLQKKNDKSFKNWKRAENNMINEKKSESSIPICSSVFLRICAGKL